VSLQRKRDTPLKKKGKHARKRKEALDCNPLPNKNYVFINPLLLPYKNFVFVSRGKSIRQRASVTIDKSFPFFFKGKIKNFKSIGASPLYKL